MKNKLIAFFLTIFIISFAHGIVEGRSIRAPRGPDKEWEVPSRVERSTTVDHVWEGVRSRRFEYTEPLTLAELVVIALANNPSTREAWENARAQDAVATQSNSAWYPKAKLNMDWGLDRTVANKRIVLAATTRSYYGPSAAVTWLLFDFGGRSGSDQQARQTLLAANFLFNQSMQDLLLDTEKAYYGLVSAKSNVEASEADVADAKASYVDAQEKFNVGIVSKLDVLQAKSTYDDSLYNLENAKGELQDARAELAKTVGVPADTSIVIAEPSEDMPEDIIDAENVTIIIEEALKRRPDISAARAQLKAKEAAVKKANSDLWPTLGARGNAGYNWYEYAGEMKNLPISYKEEYSYGGSLHVEWDIFDAFDNLFKKRQAQREADAKRENLINTEITASADVWSKYYGLKTAQKKFVFSKAFLESSEESHALAAESYKAGLKSILDLLQSQSQLSSARTKFIQAREDLFVAVAEFAHATGSLSTASIVEPGADGNQ